MGKVLIYILLYYATEVVTRPIERTCFFNQERKSPLETEDRSEKAVIDSVCSGDLIQMEDLMIRDENDGSLIIDARHSLELILCRAAGLCSIDWDDEEVVEKWKNKFICQYHYKEIFKEWGYGSAHLYRKYDGTPVCSIDLRIGSPNHIQRPVLKKRHRTTLHEAEAILHLKGILVPPGTLLCKKHKQLTINMVTKYNSGNDKENDDENEDDKEDSSRKSETPDEPSEPSQGSCSSVERSYKMEEFRKWTSFLREKNVARRDDLCYAELSRSQKYEVMALSKRLLNVQCELLSNGDGTALWEDTCSDGTEKLNENKDYIHIMENMAFEFLQAGTREERLLVLSLIAPSVSNAEIRRFLPGLSDYYCTEARRRAKGLKSITVDRRRVRYYEKAINCFVEFITSPSQTIGMPYGSRKIKFTDGHREDIINVVRKNRNSNVIYAYEVFLEQTGQEHLLLPRSTAFRMLEYCSAARSKMTACVDYFYADAIEAMDPVIEAIERWNKEGLIDEKESHSLKVGLQDGFLYYNTDFRFHLKRHSRVSEFDMEHALTESADPSPCQNAAEPHEHSLACERCDNINLIIDELEETAKGLIRSIRNEPQKQAMSEKLAEDLHNIHLFARDLSEFKKHQLRAEFTQRETQEILSNLKSGEALVVCDWAQKWLPARHLEKQLDYYGKKGVSWHISHATTVINGNLATHSTVHIVGADNQDSSSVTALLDHLLSELFHQGIRKVILKSDNAGAYHCSSTISSLENISKKSGVKIMEVIYSESQDGKSSCDRTASHVKRHVRDMLDSGTNADTAGNFFEAATMGKQLTGVSYYLGTIKDKKTSKSKLKGISSLNYFRFERDHLVAMTYKNIGKESKTPYSDLQSNRGKFQEEKAALSSNNFWKIHQNEKEVECKENPEDSPEEDQAADDDESCEASKLFTCPVCGESFLRHSNLERHLLLGKHKINPVKVSSRDYTLNLYKQKLEGVSTNTLPVIKTALESVDGEKKVTPLPQGWALKQRRTGRFSPEVIQFLNEEFKRGWEQSEKKVDEKGAYQHMKTARRVDGSLRFTPEERLSTRQIKSYFARLASLYKKNGGPPPTTTDPMTKEDLEGDFELYHEDDEGNDKPDDALHRVVRDHKQALFAEEDQVSEEDQGSAKKKPRKGKFRQE